MIEVFLRVIVRGLHFETKTDVVLNTREMKIANTSGPKILLLPFSMIATL